jgi:hypothetical protein
MPRKRNAMMVLLGNSEQEAQRLKVLAADTSVLMEIGAADGRGDKARADGKIAEAFAVPALTPICGEDRVEVRDDRAVVEIFGVELGKRREPSKAAPR